jgi:hypothetical protein
MGPSSQKLLGGGAAARRILGGVDAGVGEAEERDVGGHCFPSSYGSRQRGSALLLPQPPSSRLEQRNRAKRGLGAATTIELGKRSQSMSPGAAGDNEPCSASG